MPKATPPTSWPCTSAGFTARPTSAPTTIRRSAMRAGLRIDVEHDRARAPRVGHLRHLERGAGGQASLGGQLGQRDAAAAGLERPAAHVTSASATPRRAAARGRASAMSLTAASAAAFPGGTGPASRRCRRRSRRRRCRRGARGSARREGRAPRRGSAPAPSPAPGPMDDAPVSTTSVPSARASTCVVSNGPRPVFSTYTARPMPRRKPGPRVQRRLLGPRLVVVEPAQQLGEQRGEIAGVVDGARRRTTSCRSRRASRRRRIRLRRRISAGSRPRRAAPWSSSRSRTKLHSGRPGERRVPAGVLLVTTDQRSHA